MIKVFGEAGLCVVNDGVVSHYQLMSAPDALCSTVNVLCPSARKLLLRVAGRDMDRRGEWGSGTTAAGVLPAFYGEDLLGGGE